MKKLILVGYHLLNLSIWAQQSTETESSSIKTADAQFFLFSQSNPRYVDGSNFQYKSKKNFLTTTLDSSIILSPNNGETLRDIYAILVWNTAHKAHIIGYR